MKEAGTPVDKPPRCRDTKAWRPPLGLPTHTHPRLEKTVGRAGTDTLSLWGPVQGGAAGLGRHRLHKLCRRARPRGRENKRVRSMQPPNKAEEAAGQEQHSRKEWPRRPQARSKRGGKDQRPGPETGRTEGRDTGAADSRDMHRSPRVSHASSASTGRASAGGRQGRAGQPRGALTGVPART